MNTRPPLIASVLLAASLISGTAQAALQARDLDGNATTAEAYYDTDLTVTWLADAQGGKAWADATAWAADLSIVDSFHSITYDNWRLPTVKPINGISFNYTYSSGGSTDFSYNVSAPSTVYAGSFSSELAFMYHNTLGNQSRYSPDGWLSHCDENHAHSCLHNTGPFTNLKSGLYWSGTTYAKDVENTAWAWSFSTESGIQAEGPKFNDYYYSWAVSDGDIGIASIPEPKTYAMLLVGLGLVAAIARRRKIAKV